MSGTRKHLNRLLDDYDARAKVYRDELPESPSKPRRDAQSREAAILQEKESSHAARNTTDYWLPPYEKAVRERERRAALAEGEAEAREVAMSVNNRRTPSGNFFSTVNPSLRKETDESASRKTTATMRDELDTLNHEITLRREETLRREAEVLQSLGKQTAVADKTWVMQAGEQQKMAKLIGTKRTPTGGFFLEQ